METKVKGTKRFIRWWVVLANAVENLYATYHYSDHEGNIVFVGEELFSPAFFYSLPGKSSSENSHRLPPRNSLKTFVLIRVWAEFVLSIGLACNIITVLYTIFSKNCRSLGGCFPLEPLFRCVATVGDLFPEPLRPCDFCSKNHKVFREPPSCQTSALCELKSCTPIRM